MIFGPWAQTYTGGAWPIYHPAPEHFDVRDLRALVHICRFGGHVRGAHYSVAEHSLRCMMLVERDGASPEIAWAALVHDAHEVFGLGDVIFPAKCDHEEIPPSLSALPSLIRELERRTREAVRTALQAPLVMPDAVKRADLVMLATEKRDLLLPSEREWDALPEPDKPLITPMQPWLVWVLFRDHFNRLAPAGVPRLP